MNPVAPRHPNPNAPVPRRRTSAALLSGLSVVAGLGLTLAPTGTVAGAAPAPNEIAPNEIVGDPHSPHVARLAEEALVSLAAYDVADAPADESVYVDDLMATAGATADELGISEIALQRAWGRAARDHQVAVLTALTQLGVPYRSNTSEEGVGFDCSGLTSFAWGEAGVDLARQSGAQINDTEAREPGTAMAGDLAQYPGHVMMYLGADGAVVHAANPESEVELWRLNERRAASVRYGDPTDS
ncbi:hypothetical protein BH24ACT5_BH24ACT5_28100 [soil metagenome]